jgi:hypothetical protein
MINIIWNRRMHACGDVQAHVVGIELNRLSDGGYQEDDYNPMAENMWWDVARLHVEIDNLNDLLVGFCFIRDIDRNQYVANIREAIDALWHFM